MDNGREFFINPTRTDEQLAQEARHSLARLLACTGELSRRGYMTYMRAASGYSVGWPETIDIKKEVTL